MSVHAAYHVCRPAGRVRQFRRLHVDPEYDSLLNHCCSARQKKNQATVLFNKKGAGNLADMGVRRGGNPGI